MKAIFYVFELVLQFNLKTEIKKDTNFMKTLDSHFTLCYIIRVISLLEELTIF